MPHFVALLRGINVGGRNKVSMSELRAMAEALALRKVRTLLQSGNLVFEAAAKSSAAWEKVLEQATQERFGLAIDYCVRSGAEWTKIVEGNPFSKETAQGPRPCRGHVPEARPETRLDPEAARGDQRPGARGGEGARAVPRLPGRHRHVEADQFRHRAGAGCAGDRAELEHGYEAAPAYFQSPGAELICTTSFYR